MLWPQVVSALVALWTSDTLTAFDGPSVVPDSGRDYVVVGWSGDDGEAGSVSTERSSLGNDLLTETGTVVCVLVAQSGTTSLLPVRLRAFALADVLVAQVAADQSLGGLLTNGAVAVDVSVLSVQNERGAAQRLVLSVTYTCLT